MTQHERVADMKGMLERAWKHAREAISAAPTTEEANFDAACIYVAVIDQVIQVMQHALDKGLFDNSNPAFPDLAPGIKLTTP